MSRNDLAKLERLRSVWDAAVIDAARTSALGTAGADADADAAWDTADAALGAYHDEIKKTLEEKQND